MKRSSSSSGFGSAYSGSQERDEHRKDVVGRVGIEVSNDKLKEEFNTRISESEKRMGNSIQFDLEPFPRFKIVFLLPSTRKCSLLVFRQRV